MTTLDGSVSSEAPVTSGIPQGSVLGPLLFLIYINDLPSCARSSETRFFADDCVHILYRRITSSHDHDLLQKDLDSLQRWEDKWLMEFNLTKCQVVKITNKRNPLPTSYNIRGHTLEVANSAKYLGVETDSELSFNSHVDSICKKANSTRAFLSRNFSKCSRNIKEACYTTYVRPIAEYAASSWDPHTQRKIKKVEQVQRSSARFVMNNNDRSSSVTTMLQELQWPSLESRRLQSRLAMMYRIRFDHVDINWRQYLQESSTHTHGHNSRFWMPFCRNQVYTSSFFPRTIWDWNELKIDPADVPSLDAFKSALRKSCSKLHHGITIFTCTTCIYGTTAILGCDH